MLFDLPTAVRTRWLVEGIVEGIFVFFAHCEHILWGQIESASVVGHQISVSSTGFVVAEFIAVALLLILNKILLKCVWPATCPKFHSFQNNIQCNIMQKEVTFDANHTWYLLLSSRWGGASVFLLILRLSRNVFLLKVCRFNIGIWSC